MPKVFNICLHVWLIMFVCMFKLTQNNVAYIIIYHYFLCIEHWTYHLLKVDNVYFDFQWN